MGKLVVLAEINCLKSLNNLGVFPDSFYTDYDLFKKKQFMLSDSHVIVVFAGSCSFKKRYILETIDDIGVSNVTVISDVYLPSLDRYYKYQGKLTNISEYSGWKLKEKDSDIWDRIPKGVRGTDTQIYLKKSDINAIRDTYKARTSSEDELRHLIKKPEI